MSKKTRSMLIWFIFFMAVCLPLVPFQSLHGTPCTVKTPVLLTCDSVWYVRQGKHYQDNTPIFDDTVQWIIEIPLTYIENLNGYRTIKKGGFIEDISFRWECDTAPGDMPKFYLGEKSCYGREIFTKNYAIRKQLVICYVPQECSIEELKNMVIREIELTFARNEYITVTVPVGECRLTFDEAEIYNGIRDDFLNTVTSEFLHELLERRDYGDEAGMQFMDTGQITEFLVGLS